MAAVSIQLMPRSAAWRIAAIDCLSSWLPQPTAQSPPPIAQAPRPTGVMCMSVRPSRRFGSAVLPTCSAVCMTVMELSFATARKARGSAGGGQSLPPLSEVVVGIAPYGEMFRSRVASNRNQTRRSVSSIQFSSRLAVATSP